MLLETSAIILDLFILIFVSSVGSSRGYIMAEASDISKPILNNPTNLESIVKTVVFIRYDEKLEKNR